MHVVDEKDQGINKICEQDNQEEKQEKLDDDQEMHVSTKPFDKAKVHNHSRGLFK